MSSNVKQIAKQRVCALLEQVQEIRKDNPELARRYVRNARRIAMAARIRLPPEYKRHICKNCDTLLVYGENCRVRLRQKREFHVVITCNECGYVTRMLLRKKTWKTSGRGENKSEQNNFKI